jgi:PEP-CTERM motif
VRNLKVFAFVFALLLATSSALSASPASFTVGSTAGPWLQSANPGFPYGVGDNAGPTAVNSGNSGLNFNPGDVLTITYVSGLTSAFGGTPTVDANGYVGGPFGCGPGLSGIGSSGTFFPCVYTDLSQNTWLNELMGTFADNSGVIVGSPFTIGNGPFSIAVPSGATQLLMGVSDDIYGDNTGSLVVSVSGPSSVPEPSSLVLLGTGVVSLLGWRRKRNS